MVSDRCVTPAGTRYGLVDMLAGHMESSAGGSPARYAAVFASFIQGLVPYLDAEVVSAIEMTLSEMSEGRACPAPQLSVGSFAVASLALTMIHDLLDGRPVIASPELVIQSYRSMSTKVVSLLAAPAVAAE